jgi:hypothetical protein
MTGVETRIMEALTEVARVASVMVDGDEAARILTDRALSYIAHPDPEHRHLAGDYYDVDHAAFLRMKKVLLRLERLLDFPCSTSLWVQVDDLSGYATLAVQNGSVHRYYRFGQEKLKMPKEMAECIEGGRVTVAPCEHPQGMLTVLAPVLDSLGDVVGVVELSAFATRSRLSVPAWS